MYPDPIVSSAIIGLVGVVVGIMGYALQNWLVKKREIDTKLYILKRQRYEDLSRNYHMVSISFKPEGKALHLTSRKNWMKQPIFCGSMAQTMC